MKLVREAMGLDPFAFAVMLGVHVSTVYRWEGAKTLNLDPLQDLVIGELFKRAHRQTDMRDLGEAVKGSLVAGDGTLGALYVVLHFLKTKR